MSTGRHLFLVSSILWAVAGVPISSEYERTAAENPCCSVCVAPQEKYYSVDTTHNMCGEACMNPHDFLLYKIFERNLEKAPDDTPCASHNFRSYNSTVTHGFGPIKMTLDLYNADTGVSKVSLYRILDKECGQIAVSEAIAKAAKAVPGVMEGTCADVGYTVAKADDSPFGEFDAIFIKPVAKLAVRLEEDTKCSPVTPVGPSLNLTEWARASWYPQQQQLTGYQHLDDLFCVTATYQAGEEHHDKVPFFEGEVIAVHNYATKGSTSGTPEQPDNKTVLCARVPDATNPSKLLVAPCFLPNFLAGDYWIIAVGDETGENASAERYEWAVVSGGQPTVEYSDGCTTKETGTYGGVGMWIFSRQPVANQSVVDLARAAMVKQNITLSRLHPVDHTNCSFAGAFIKPDTAA
eukprot:CAMPEP_0114559610 /NCGR_PEP_ID=MMETSP0114-20121206/11013_1 /TAXON_ID=31324 /ORGANISM="Goniomonas sp, Strain m" /LENGTH=407 /DNA_ID=CAMNT_0001745091 /DNA_START=9 /DNA_END=1232 /DNA_ORIENTATION=+